MKLLRKINIVWFFTLWIIAGILFYNFSFENCAQKCKNQTKKSCCSSEKTVESKSGCSSGKKLNIHTEKISGNCCKTMESNLPSEDKNPIGNLNSISKIESSLEIFANDYTDNSLETFIHTPVQIKELPGTQDIYLFVSNLRI